MAEAFLALSGELPGLRTLVVVKRILPHLADNEQFVRMFLDEARIGALLDHPNITRIIEVGHDEDGYFLAMEAVPGKTLSAILRRAARRERPLGQADVAFIVGRAAAALVAHRRRSAPRARCIVIAHAVVQCSAVHARARRVVIAHAVGHRATGHVRALRRHAAAHRTGRRIPCVIRMSAVRHLCTGRGRQRHRQREGQAFQFPCFHRKTPLRSQNGDAAFGVVAPLQIAAPVPKQQMAPR